VFSFERFTFGTVLLWLAWKRFQLAPFCWDRMQMPPKPPISSDLLWLALKHLQAPKLCSTEKINLGCVPKVAIGKSAGNHQSVCGGLLESGADFGNGSNLWANLAMECNANDLKSHFYKTVRNKYHCRVWVQDSRSSTPSCNVRVGVGALTKLPCVRNP